MMAKSLHLTVNIVIYLHEQQLKQQNLLAQVAGQKQQQRTSHQSLMQEQQRAKK